METTTLFTENNPTLFSIEMNVDIADYLQCAFQALKNDPGILDVKWPGLSTQETVFFKVDSSPVFLVFSAALERRA